MSDIQTVDITIAELSSKLTSKGSTRISLTDEKGLKYSYFTTKMDGTPTKAHEQGQGLHIGDKVCVGFKNYEGDFQGKKFTGRTILFFEPVTR